MKKLMISFILLFSAVSVQSMSLRPLIKITAQTSQTVVGKRDIHALTVVLPTLLAGTTVLGVNLKLALDMNKVQDKIKNNLNEKEAAQFKADNFILLSTPNDHFINSNFTLTTANLMGSFGQTDLVITGVSVYLVLYAAMETTQGFIANKFADEKVDALIQEKQELKKKTTTFQIDSSMFCKK